jgi:hypothetical protein
VSDIRWGANDLNLPAVFDAVMQARSAGGIRQVVHRLHAFLAMGTKGDIGAGLQNPVR